MGEGVTHVAVGDRVMAGFRWGGMAQEALVDSHRVAKIPAAMPLHEAAAFGLTYGTSYHALKLRGALKAGDSVPATLPFASGAKLVVAFKVGTGAAPAAEPAGHDMSKM